MCCQVLLYLNVGSRFAAEFTTAGIPFAGVFPGYATPTPAVCSCVSVLFCSLHGRGLQFLQQLCAHTASA